MLITRNMFSAPFKQSQFSLMCCLDNFILGMFRNIPKVGVIIVMFKSCFSVNILSFTIEQNNLLQFLSFRQLNIYMTTFSIERSKNVDITAFKGC